MEVIFPSHVPATATFIFLHGLGDNGHGWAAAFQRMRGLFPFMRWIFPHATSHPVTINGGMKMPSWYDIKGFSEDSPQDAPGHERSKLRINNYIENEIKSGIATNRIFLGGFSQGGAVALHTGLSRAEPLGGIISISSYLPLVETNYFKSFPMKSIPIFFGHGSEDQIISVAWGGHSVKTLQESGYNRITFMKYSNVGHEASEEELNDVSNFLKSNLLLPNSNKSEL